MLDRLSDGRRQNFVPIVYMLSALAAAISISAVAVAQGAPGNAGSSVDLSRYYFPSSQQEISDRFAMNAALDRLGKLKGPVNSASQLMAVLQAADAARILFARHDDYLYLRCAINRKDSACDDEGKLDSEYQAKTAFFEPEIFSIPGARLREFLSKQAELRQYSFELSDIRRKASHLLPEAQEKILDEFNPEISDWQYGLYRQITGAIQFGLVQTQAGPLDVIRQRNLIAANTDAQVREQGFRKRYVGYSGQRDLLAFTLVHTVQAQQALAKAHNFADAPARKYASLYLDPADARNLLALMARQGQVAKRYESIRLRELERAYGEPAHVWDLSAPDPGLSVPTIQLSEARTMFHETFAGLGKEYQAAFDSLIDAANGRADILPGGAANRYGGGFSLGSGATSILFYGRYDGTFKDLSVIAHEGGHAVHRQLMNDNGVLQSYKRGPNFLSESFAEFNELLLADYMAEHAASPELRRYYRERWMSIKGLDAFYGAQDALLEQEIYDGVSAGTVRNADDLDKLTIKIDSQFSHFPESVPELRNRWAMVSLMFEDPLYSVNYVYGGLLALKYYELYSTRREWFVPRYVALLKNGINKTPRELLREFLEIDLSASSLLNDDLALLNHRMDKMETENSTQK